MQLNIFPHPQNEKIWIHFFFPLYSEHTHRFGTEMLTSTISEQPTASCIFILQIIYL